VHPFSWVNLDKISRHIDSYSLNSFFWHRNHISKNDWGYFNEMVRRDLPENKVAISL
jgi:hypothetical protein